MSTRRNFGLGLCAATAGVLLAGQAKAVMLVELKFNADDYVVDASGQTAVNNGAMSNFALLAFGSDYGIANGVATDLHTADALGVSGLAGDRAFDNSGAQLRNVPGLGSDNYSGGVAYLNEDPGGAENTNQTISGWFRTKAGTNWGEQPQIGAPDDHATATYLFHYRNGSSKEEYLYNSKDWGTNEAAVRYAVSGTTALLGSGGDVWLGVDKWIFFAMTYDATTGTAYYYEGDLTTGVHLVGTSPANGDSTAGALNSSGPITWGADRNMLNAFDGYLDNLRWYNDTLDATALEALRIGDGGLPVPEPASLGLLGLGLLMAARRRRA